MPSFSSFFSLFSLCLLSHLLSSQVNRLDMSNDTDPLFTAEFYKNLKILSQDLYKRSAATAMASSSSNPSGAGGGGSGVGGGGGGGASASGAGSSNVAPRRMSRFGSLRSILRGVDTNDPASAAAAVSAAMSGLGAGGGGGASAASTKERSGSGSFAGMFTGTSTGNTGGGGATATATAGVGGSDLSGPYFDPASADYFTAEALRERMKVYAKEGGIPLDYIDRYAEYSKNKSSTGAGAGAGSTTAIGSGAASGGGGGGGGLKANSSDRRLSAQARSALGD
jgi:hypothetical protein